MLCDILTHAQARRAHSLGPPDEVSKSRPTASRGKRDLRGWTAIARARRMLRSGQGMTEILVEVYPADNENMVIFL